LLAQLAVEQGLMIKLMLGIYLMNERNTPGVGRVLSKYGLCEIPEAHCYLLQNVERIDVTRPVLPPRETIDFVEEEELSPEQIGDYKTARHKAFIQKWLRSANLSTVWSLERLWTAREECIAAPTK